MKQREIKFRMWGGPESPTMFYKVDNVAACLSQQMHFDALGKPPFGYDHRGLHGSVFMQFTGLHDITHEELYEGDIVMRERKGEFIRSKIVFEEGSFKLSQTLHLNSRTIFKFRVNKIGNIYETPDLLK